MYEAVSNTQYCLFNNVSGMKDDGALAHNDKDVSSDEYTVHTLILLPYFATAVQSNDE